jgi:hypothetical protein
MRSIRAMVVVAVALAACTGPVHPTYEFEAAYVPLVATPSAIAADLRDYARQICGRGGHKVLDQLLVGEGGPNYVRVRFACS